MNAAFTFGKFITGALASAALTVFGVWTVVGLALTGMSSAVDATNQAITRLDSRVAQIETKLDGKLETLNARLDAIVLQLGEGFKDTKAELQKKANLDVPIDPADSGDRFAHDGTAEMLPKLLEAKAFTDSVLSKEPTTVFVPTRDAFSRTGLASLLGADPTKNQEQIDALVKTYRIPGTFQLEQLKSMAAETEAGVSFQTEDGRTLRAKYIDNTLTLIDEAGDVANITSGETYSDNLAIYSIDNALN